MEAKLGAYKEKEKTSVSAKKYMKSSGDKKKNISRKENPMDILYRLQQNPNSMTHEDMMILEGAMGHQAVVKLMANLKNIQKSKQPDERKKTDKAEVKKEEATSGSKNLIKKTPKLKVVKKTNENKAISKQKDNKEKTVRSEKEVMRKVSSPVAVRKSDVGLKKSDTKKVKLAKATEGALLNVNAADKKKETTHKAVEQEVSKATPAKSTEGSSRAKESTSGVEAAQVAQEKKAAVKQKSVHLKGGNPETILEQLQNSSPTDVINAFSSAVGLSDSALQEQQHKTEGVLPHIPAPTGLMASSKPIKKAKGSIKGISHRVIGSFKSEKRGEKANKGKFEAFDVASRKEDSGDIDDLMKTAKTHLSNGPAMDMTGEADPSQIGDFKSEATQNVKEAQQAELGQTDNDFGENGIYPDQDNKVLKAENPVRAVTVPKIDLIKGVAVSEKATGKVNNSLAAMLKSHMSDKLNQYKKGKLKFDAEVVTAKSGTASHIEGLKSDAKKKQLSEQEKAKREVSGLKNDWKKEIKNASAEYEIEANVACEDKKKEIGHIKAEKEEQVQRTMQNAQKEADNEYKNAKKKTEDKKKEGEKGNGGIIGWIKDKAEKVIDGIKSVVKAVFDGLRKAVKFILDKAKKLAVGIIEAGRKLITGVILKLGNVLKGLVKKVFAKFPGIANKICSSIDGVVNKAISAVNRVADTLKKGVTLALNVLAKTLDKALSVIGSLYNGILSGIGNFLKGDFKKIFGVVLEAAEIAAELALAFATGGGSILIQIGLWLAKTLPELLRKVSAVMGFVNTIRNLKLQDIKQFLSPGNLGDYLVKGLFGELKPLPQLDNGEKDAGEENGDKGQREGGGLLKVFAIIQKVFKVLKGVYGKVAGAINKALTVMNITSKAWFGPFSMVYAGAVKAIEIAKNPGQALSEGVGKLKELVGTFFGGIKGKITEVATSLKEKVMILGKPAQLLKLIANKAVDMVLNFIVTHPPSALVKAAFKAVEAVSGKSIIELVRQYIPFADKLINKIAESGPVQGILKPLEQPVNKVGGMIDGVGEKAVLLVDDTEQKTEGLLGSGEKLIKNFAGAAGIPMGKEGDASKGEKKKEEGKEAQGNDFLGRVKSGIHSRLMAAGEKRLLQKGKALVKSSADKIKSLIFGPKLKFKIGNEEHELWIELRGNKKVIMLASVPKDIWEKIEVFHKELSNRKNKNNSKNSTEKYTQETERLENEVNNLVKKVREAELIKDESQVKNSLTEIEGIVAKIGADLGLKQKKSKAVDKDQTKVEDVNGTTKIPSVRGGKFSEWFDSLSIDEFNKIWENNESRDIIEDRLRSPGGLHEWHLVSRAPIFKKWGVTAKDIADMRTPTKNVKFKNPSGEHGGEGSTTAHNELLRIIDSSPDYQSFIRRLQDWADNRLVGGAAALPGKLKR